MLQYGARDSNSIRARVAPHSILQIEDPMNTLKALVLSILTALFFLTCAPASASEVTAQVRIKSIDISTNVANTNQGFYVMPDGPWGFTSTACSAANATWIVFFGVDGASKQWLALLLTAKATGALVQIWIDDCSTGKVIH